MRIEPRKVVRQGQARCPKISFPCAIAMNKVLLRTLLFLFFGPATDAVHAKPFIYATTGNNEVAVIDTADHSIVTTIPVTNFAGRIAFTPDGAFAYVTTLKSVLVISTSTRSLISTIPLCCNLRDIAVSPDGASVYVTGANFNALAEIETRSNRVVAIVSTGVGPYGVAISPDGTTVYVTNSSANTVSMIDSASKRTVATIPLGYQPLGISLSSDGKHAYITNSVSNDVSVIDTATKKVVSIIPVGTTPAWVSTTPDNRFAYVLNLNSNDVSVIDSSKRTVVETLPMNSSPGGVAMGSDGTTVYVSTAKGIVAVETTTHKVVAYIPMSAGVASLAVLPEAAVGSANPGPAFQSSVYSIAALGLNSEAIGINDLGQVVGTSFASGPLRSFIWSDGTTTDPGTLGGLDCVVTAINNKSQVVGYGSYDRGYHAFVYRNQKLEDLNPAGSRFAEARDINDEGMIVGRIQMARPGPTHAFLFSKQQMKDLGTLGGQNSAAHGINNAGNIVGVSQTTDKNEHAFLYVNGMMKDLGTLGGLNSAAIGINGSGQVAGYSEIAGEETSAKKTRHAFLYYLGLMTDLGVPTGGTHSEARGINDAGDVVGFAYVNGGRRAFLFSQGRMRDLNDLIPPDSGWILSDANAINNRGQIVGTATFKGGLYAYLLTPKVSLKKELSTPSKSPLASSSFFLEAESGVLSSPMSVFSDAQASGEKYISSSSDGSAVVRFLIDVQTEGAYSIWCRMLALSPGAGSFSVSIDGGPEKNFVAGKGKELSSWQWRRISSIASGDPLKRTPTLFNLTKGSHTIEFKTKPGMREASRLDRLIVTSDPNYVPKN